MDDVTLQFGANTSGIDQGSAAVSNKLNDLKSQTESMKSGFDSLASAMGDSFKQGEEALTGLGEQIKSVNESISKGGATLDTGWMKLLIGGAAGAGVAAVVKAFHDLEEEFLKLDKNAQDAGISLQKYQEIQYAMAKSGGGTEKTASDLQAIAKSLLDMSYDAGNLGKFLDANNIKWKDTKGDVVSINQYIDQLANLFQRAYAEGGAPLLNKVAETVHVSQQFAQAMVQGTAGLKLTADEAHKLGAVLSDEVIHKSADFEKEWNAASLRWSTYLKSLIVSILPFVEDLIQKLQGGIQAVIDKMADWGKAWDNLHPKGDGIIDTIKKTGAAWLDASKDLDKFKGDWDSLHGSSATFSDRFTAAAGTLTDFTDKFKSLTTETTKVDVGVKNISEDLKAAGDSAKKIQFPGSDKSEKFDSTALREFQAELDRVKQKYDEIKIKASGDVAAFQITEGQKVAIVRAALAERETATNAIFAEEIAKYGDNAARRAQIELQYQKQIHQIQLEGLREEEELLKKRAQEWNSMLTGLSTAFTGQLRGILTGTTTWSQAIKNIMLDLVLKIIDEFLKLAVIKPLSGMLASALEAPSEIFADIIKVIKNMFGPLFAGFTAFFAPVQGPAAPAEGAGLAAATVATAVGAVALATGTDYVPQTGLALLHQGEAVIPASANVEPYGGGSGHSFNINLSAVDVQSFNAWLRNGGGANMLAKTISDILRRNPTLRPSY